jgi:predicted AlkP superfamily pyrophosphatase or phosphodiesterase
MWTTDRVVVLGVDALEHDLVVERELETLLQVRHGRVALPEMDQIHTQVIWPTFFTGLPPEEHGITLETRHEWRNPVVRLLKHTAGRLLPPELRSRIGAALRSSGFEMSYRDRSYFDINDIDTLFSHVSATVISVPGYNEDEVNEEIRVEMHAVLERDGDREAFIDRCGEVLAMRSERVMRAVRGDDRLVMAHLYTPDAVGHVCYNDPDTLAAYYRRVGTLVEDVAAELDEEDLLLVVSDHGMCEGRHTPYGFYSIDRDLDWDEEVPVTAFYERLLGELGIDLDDVRTRREVAEHLEDLGYV